MSLTLAQPGVHERRLKDQGGFRVGLGSFRVGGLQVVSGLAPEIQEY